jgi:branched-subunit amino acid ABC-type transport system permease component
MEFVTQSLVIGLTENAPLVLAAIGFALLYKLTGLINVAYSETITLGAYFGMWLNTTYGLDFYAILIPTGVLAGVLSVATYLAIFRPAKRRNVGVLELIVISFGLSIFLRHGLQFVFGYPVRFYDVPPPDTILVLGVGVSSFRLLALVSVAVLALLLYLFIQRSSLGLKIRALASDEGLAQVSGIRPLVVTVLIWFIAGVAGGLAGAFYGVGSNRLAAARLASVPPHPDDHPGGTELGPRRGDRHRHRHERGPDCHGAPVRPGPVRAAGADRHLRGRPQGARLAPHRDGDGVAPCPSTGWTPS